MKKVRLIIVSVISILTIFICDNVFAKTCEYEYEFLLYSDGQIDTTATAYNGEKVSFEIDDGNPSINIKNWEVGRTSCPDYVVKKLTEVSGGFLCIGTTNTYSYWSFDAGIDWESDEAADAREFVDVGLCGSPTTKVFKNTNPEQSSTPPITCEYSGFKLEIDPDSHALSADSTQNSLALYYIYDVDGGLNDEWFYDDGTLGKCLDVLVCYDRSMMGGGGSPTIMYYTVYMDELHVPRNEYSDDDCKKVSYSGTDESKKPNENSYKCTTYGNKIGKIRDLYTALGDAKKEGLDTPEMYVEVEKEVYSLQIMCEAAYTTFNYSSDCVKECTGLEAEIAKIKASNGIDSVNGGSNGCSISERLASWIFKIIRWIRYIVPILLIVLSIMDFIKAVASDSEDEMKKVSAKFVKRLIVAALIFLIPLILEFLLGIFGIGTSDYCL